MNVVTGGSGQLGSAFRRLWPDAIFPGRDEIDLAESSIGGITDLLGRYRASTLINCAAATAVDLAESRVEETRRVNATAVGHLARACVDQGVRFVTYSTDYVFDGGGSAPYVESDPTDPINAYGTSKLEGEAAALAADPGALVVRTSWVVSGTHPNFVATMLRLASEGRSPGVVDDQWGRPTVVDDQAAATARLVGDGLTGIVHVTNTGPPTTWWELARAAVGWAGFDPELIRPCTTSEYPTPARRPAYSVLDSERIDLDDLMPDWRSSVPSVARSLAGGLG